MSSGKWERVTRSNPCPVCGKPDWCVHVESGTICARIESKVRAGDAGWFHAVGERGAPTYRPGREIRQLADDVGEIADRYFRAHTAWSARATLACRLGVDATSLERLRVGWNERDEAWTFPMRDARGRVVGIQNRYHPHHGKRVVRGHRSGVFEPFQLDVRGGELLVCEGASDTAAALSIGLEAIGRFSCSATIDEIVARVHKHRPRLVVVIADNDVPGMRGAEQLCAKLDGIAHAEIRTPPAGIKDLRDWKQAGATAGDIRKGAAS